MIKLVWRATAAFLLLSSSAFAGTPVVTTTPPAEGFVGEQVCFNASFTNSDPAETGFGPYYRLVLEPDLTLASASFVSGALTVNTEGVFPAAPGTLIDSVTGEDVAGNEGATLYTVEYPIGSVTSGSPPLAMELCIDVDVNAVENVLQTDAIGITPAFSLGNTATGDNGPQTGTASEFDFTPRIVQYTLTDMTAEGERPPGPAWEFDIEACANIASNRVVSPLDFNTISPIVLPNNIQFVGPVTFTGTGTGCAAVTTPADLTAAPGGEIDLDCTSGQGVNGDDAEVCATFPVYITDTLDPTQCTNDNAINTAKHLAIQKGNNGATLPGGTRNYSFNIQVSEFVPGISRLETTDVLPDGLTFNDDATVSLNGGGAVSLSGALRTISNNTPGTGQTTVVFDITGALGTIPATSNVVVNYSTSIDQTFASTGGPLLSRDELANTVVAEFDVDGAGNATNCTDDSASSFTIDGIEVEKTLVSPAGGIVQPGDAVTFRLRMEIPSGDTNGIIFDDFFPLPVFDATTIDTTLNLGTNPDISYGPGDTLGLTPSSITAAGADNSLRIVWPDVNTTAAQVIEVDITATVTDEPFADDLRLSNLYQAETNNTPSDGATSLTTTAIRVRAPTLSLEKVAGQTTGLEAGDTVTYAITATNDSTAEAFDVIVSDDEPPGLTGCVLTGVTGGAGAGGDSPFDADGFEFTSFDGPTVGALDGGANVVVNVSCTVALDVAPEQEILNTATVTWASQSGSTPFAAVEAEETVSTEAQAQPAKSVLATSESATPETTPRPIAQGEVVRFRMSVAIPEGEQTNVDLIDLIPAGLQFLDDGTANIAFVSTNPGALTASGLSNGDCVAGTLEQTGALAGITPNCQLPAFGGTFNSGTDVTLALGTLQNTETDADEEFIVIELNVVALAGQTNGQTRSNRFRLDSDQATVTSPNAQVRFVEPILETTKTPSPTTADAGDTITYTIQVQHEAGSLADAFDIAFTDTLDGTRLDNFVFVSGPAAPTGETCTASGAIVDSSDPFGAGISITIDGLPQGEICEIVYTADVQSGVFPGVTIDNTANVAYDSLDGTGDAGNTTGSPQGTQGTYNADDTASVMVSETTNSKTIVSTSFAHTPETGGASAGAPRILSIGETVRFRLEIGLPEGNAPSFEITDAMPAGLQFVTGTARLAFLADGTGIMPTPAIACSNGGTLNQTGDENDLATTEPDCQIAASGGPFGSGTDPVFDLGDVMNNDSDPNLEFVILEYDALVLNETGNQQGTDLDNSFTLSIDGNAAGAPASAFTEIAEPQLACSITATPNPVDNRTDPTPTISYTYTLTNNGGATAFQAGAADASGWVVDLPTGVENITSVAVNLTGDVFLNNTATPVAATDFAVTGTDNNIVTASGGVQIAAGGSLELAFDADLQASVQPGDSLADTCVIAYRGQATGAAGDGVRDSSGLANGNGNDPITDTGTLDDYRNETPFTLNTIAENPEIGVAKQVSVGPTNNGDGTYSLTYEILVENSGDVGLENIVLTETLAATFSGATFVIDDVAVVSDSSSLVEEAGFTGTAPNNLLLDAATSTLPVGEQGTITIELTVTPGANLGPYNNSVTVAADSDRTGTTVNDVSDDGTDPDGNSNGDPTDDSDPTATTFTEAPEIGIAKRLTGAPVNNGDGTYALQYELFVSNTGDVVLDQLQVSDDLATTFSAASSFTVTNVSSATFTVNFPGYTGTAPNVDLLAGTDTIDPAADGTILIDVTVTPGANFGPFNNQAVVSGDSPTGNNFTDQSDDGTDPDGNGNGDPTDDNDTTDVTLTETPVIGLAKQLTGAPTNNADGTYSLQYRFLIENSGDVNLTDVQLTDNLAATFAGATNFVVDNVTSTDFTVNFPGFTGTAPNTGMLTGTDTLAIGANGVVFLNVTVTPGANLGPYDNTATATGDAPSGATASDDSDNAPVTDSNGNGDPTDDSDATPVSFVEGPRIGLAKSVVTGPTNNGDGTYTLTYRFVLENSGDNLLNDVNINEPLATTFASADSFVVDALTSPDFTVDAANFDGTPGNDNLLQAGNSLAVSASGTVDLTLTITPGATLGPYNNSAEGTGTSPANVPVTDTSDDGVDPDGDNDSDPNNDSDPTVSTFVEDAEIGVAKSVSSGPINNGDGTYTVGYLIRIENSGDVLLNDVAAVESLATTFAGATFVVDSLTSASLTVNPGFNGDGDTALLAAGNTLAAATTADVELTVTVTPGAALGTYNNTVSVTGESPSGATPSDDSVDGTAPDANGNGDPNDDTLPTPVTLAEAPEIGLAKAITAGPVNNQDGSYGLTYTLIVTNSGDVDLTNVSIVEPLATTFAGATYSIDALSSADLTVNAGAFDGNATPELLVAGQTLAIGDSATIVLELTVTPGANLGPYDNIATASAESPSGATPSDQSTDGAVPDANGNGDPGDDTTPTTVTFSENPEIGLAKAVTDGPINNADGTYSLTYTLVVSNSGDVDLSDVTIDEPLATTFAGAIFAVDTLSSADVTVNAGYNGNADTNLLAAGTTLTVGQAATITLAVTVTPASNLGPYNNLATATGESPSGSVLTDQSTDGAVADANGNGDPGDDTTPTPITFSETPAFGVAKEATMAQPNFDNTFSSTITVFVENTGDVVLNDVQLDEPLATNFAPAVVTSVDNVTIVGDLAATRAGFDGINESRLLPDGQSLIAGGSATITFDVTVNLAVGGQCANIPLTNTVIGNAASPSGQLLTDASQRGLDPDPDNDGDAGNNDEATSIGFAVGVDGTVTITEELLPGETIALQVIDADQNRDDALLDTVQVVVTNTTNGEIETVTLTETGAATGIFEADLATSQGNAAGTDNDGDLTLFFLDNFTATYTDTLSASGCGIDVTDAGSATGLATLVGNVWLDSNSDDTFDPGENGLEGWIIELTDSNGNVIATVPVAADGSYTIPDLEPGTGFTVTLLHPDTGTVFGQITDIDLPPDTTVLDQNLPVDPSGVVYDSVARQPIPGVEVRLVNANGDLLPAACLLPGQQSQTTAADGFYRFDVLLGADPACQSGDTFFLEFDVPDGYQDGASELIPPLADPIDPTGLGDPVRVGDDSDTPQGADSTDYYLGFTLEDNDPDVIFNHIPLDPLGVETSSVRLTKRVARPTTTVGSLVVYTVTIENLSPVTLPGIEVVDSLPPGFSYVDGSATLDGQQTGFAVSGPRPVLFSAITLAPEQLRTLRYVLRVGAGVTQGDYVNTATPTLNGGPIGNSDTAEVQVIADPDFEETTIIGKVWHDRDGDGWQDTAEATGITISGGPFTTARDLPDLMGRRSEGENVDRHQVELIVPNTDAALTVRTHEGTEVRWHNGELTTNHHGEVEKGLNAQRIEIIVEPIMTESQQNMREVSETTRVTLDQVVEPVRFESGKAAIPENYAAILRRTLDELENAQNVRLSFVGHTDNEPLSARTAAIYTDNQGLSESRAGTVARFLQNALALPDNAIEISGRGDTQPVASNATRSGMALNRRVEIEVVYDQLTDKTLTEVEVIPSTPTGESRIIVRNLGINEEGIAGVRLATVEGLIIETDSEGRYHIAAVDGGFMERGRNFIVKVDPATLPQNSEFTTENPRVKRITQGLLNQFDFGVLMPRYNVLKPAMRAFEFSPQFFTKGTADVSPLYAKLIDDLIDALTEAGGGRVVVLGDSDASANQLLNQRGMRLREVLRSRLPEAIWRNTEVYVMAQNREEPQARLRQWSKKLAAVAVGLLINTAHADEGCTIYTCNAAGQPVVTSSIIDPGDVAPIPPATDETGGRFRIALPGAGVLFATEDASALTPRLAIAGPQTLPVGHRDAVTFVAYTNYAAFIKTYALEIYREADVDRVQPLAIVRPEATAGAFSDFVYFRWQPGASDVRADERLAYVLTVADGNGQRDETGGGLIQALLPSRYQELQDKAKAAFLKQQEEQKSAPILLDGQSGIADHEAHRMLLRTYGRSQLVRQNILLNGARVRLQGHDIDEAYAVYVNGHWVPVDSEGKLVAEYLLPIGDHWAQVAVGSEKDGVWFKDIPVTVTGEHRFMVALADFTASASSLSGSVEPLSGNDRYSEDSLVEGRLAYYLKAKIKGRYLLTSQLDSREEQLDDLLGSLDDKSTRALFRRIDPDRYYPVYGDDSTTEWDTDSLGRFYVRLDWDKSNVVWGNYQTEIDDSEFIQYRRTLYGAQLSWNSVATTSRDQTRSKLNLFASETQTALGHSEFLGTGGSLYYLRHLDVIPGSDQARIEVRDADTNRVVENIPLARGRDYEIDELQGRIILGRPLLQIAQQSAPSIIKRGPLDGNLAILIVDYEYLPAGFDANQLAAGGRAKHWFGDHLAIGGSYLSEGRGGEDYALAGLDLTLAAGNGTYLKVEGASSEATQTERLFSTDGGLSFSSLNPNTQQNRAGDAVGVESRVNFQELGWTEGRTTAAAWWRRVDDQFSIARRDDGVDVYESGVELITEWGDRTTLSLRASEVEREQQLIDQDRALQFDYRIGENGTVSAEVRQLSQEFATTNQQIDATLAALRYAHQFGTTTEVYVTGQATLDNDDGQYDNNDLVSLGMTHALTGRTSITGEVSTGHRGEGASLSLSHDVNADHTIYGTMTHSTDRTDNPLSTAPGNEASGFNASRLLPGNTIAIGHRSRISNQLDVFNETTMADVRGPVSLGHVFGLNWSVGNGYSVGTTIQRSDINAERGIVERTAFTLSGGYRSAKVNWVSRIEYRDDDAAFSAENVRQWASINRLDYKLSESFRLLSRLNYADTEDNASQLDNAKLVEGGLGVAYRPVANNRINWLAKYTYLYDLTSAGQVDQFNQTRTLTDQRSHIGSIEGIKRFGPKWSLGAKLARRVSELRLSRDAGDWFDSTTDFAAIRGRYHLISRWDALLEYRWLRVDEAESERAGWLIGVDRHVGDHMKIGIGYNFTDFSDDLTRLDYEYDGFFLNVLGKY